MKKSILAFAALAAAMTAVPALAAPYSFTFAPSTALFGAPVSGSGTFFTSSTSTIVGGQTAYAITSITGTINGVAINAPTGSYGNYFTTGPSFLDGTGVTFSTTGGTLVTFFNQSSNGIYRVNTQSPGSSEFVTATSALIPTPVTGAAPEPATWALMILGFGLAGTMLRRRHRVTARVRFA